MSGYFELDEPQLARLKEIGRRNDAELSPYACRDADAVYLTPQGSENPLRPAFSRDCDFILNSPFYNRYTDKTQVFSFYKNDDLTRRALHVQLVSKIARNIGRALELNLDLIEAIALAHDMGHTPFGHKGEEYLSLCYHAHAGKYFNHNVHSARIFRNILDCKISLQVLSGVLSHNGERVSKEYSPSRVTTFEDFDAILEQCYLDNEFHKTLRPNTLEGCVVRLSDIIAYIGKDRQDLYRSGLKFGNSFSAEECVIGKTNREYISNLIANLVKNSMGKPSLGMDEEVFRDMERVVKENYEVIYRHPELNAPYEQIVHPLMEGLYERLLDDVKRDDRSSPVFRHYLNDKFQGKHYFDDGRVFLIADPNDVVTDFIASMTDDYFIDICKYLHIDDRLTSPKTLRYKEYFD